MFITFEGPDGSGKSTQMKLLADYLAGRGFPVSTTREPGGTPIGDQIRQVLLDPANRAMHARTEILLFIASRAQHTEEVIRPRLRAGEIVLCDRYRDSTVAYQGYGQGVDRLMLESFNDFATGGLLPDLTLLLDLPAEIGLERRSRAGDWNRLDALTVAFHQRVRDGYLQLAAAHPERWAVIDADREAGAVADHVRQVVEIRLATRKTA